MELYMSIYADDILLCRPIYKSTDYHDLQCDVNNLCAWTDGKVAGKLSMQLHDYI